MRKRKFSKQSVKVQHSWIWVVALLALLLSCGCLLWRLHGMRSAPIKSEETSPLSYHDRFVRDDTKQSPGLAIINARDGSISLSISGGTGCISDMKVGDGIELNKGAAKITMTINALYCDVVSDSMLTGRDVVTLPSVPAGRYEVIVKVVKTAGPMIRPYQINTYSTPVVLR